MPFEVVSNAGMWTLLDCVIQAEYECLSYFGEGVAPADRRYGVPTIVADASGTPAAVSGIAVSSVLDDPYVMDDDVVSGSMDYSFLTSNNGPDDGPFAYYVTATNGVVVEPKYAWHGSFNGVGTTFVGLDCIVEVSDVECSAGAAEIRVDAGDSDAGAVEFLDDDGTTFVWFDDAPVVYQPTGDSVQVNIDPDITPSIVVSGTGVYGLSINDHATGPVASFDVPGCDFDAVFECVADQFLLPVEVELAQDVADVVLHRLRRDVQLLADLPVGVAPGHVLEDLALPLGQGLDSSGLPAQPAEFAQDQAGQLG